MKYRVTLKDGLDILVTAESEIDAVRTVKGIKDKLAEGSDSCVQDTENRDVFIIALRNILKELESEKIDLKKAKQTMQAFM